MKQDRILTVESETTLLPFLLEHVKGISRNSVKSLLTRRQVLVDGAPVTRHDHPLTPAMKVEILAPGAKAPPFPILYEDEQLLVVDKPAGLLTVATEKEKNKTAYRMAGDYLKGRGQRVFIVHRLDKDTSGVLIFAKSEKVKRAYQDNWDALVKRRAYLALVEGRPKEPEGMIRSYLKETDTHLVYSVERAGGNAKEAITSYRLLAEKGALSLLEVELATGRKNQIRVHMKELGCPIAGDKQYGARTNPIGRLCLHAGELSFLHPVSGEPMTFLAKTPRDFNRVFR